MEATVGVSKTWATVLFVDVDGFEDACRGMGPDDVNLLLARVFEKIAFAISNNRGTLLEFIGDEVLAVFNTPSPLRSHTYAAVITALEIHQHIATLPPLKTPDGRTINIRCRCGVHTAQILAGNIGSHRRMKYGLLGDGVNLTARLKGLNSRYNTQTIASETCYSDELSSRRVIFRPLDLVAVKGKTEALMVYEIMDFSKGSDETYLVHMAAKKHSEAFRLYHARRFAEAKVMFSEVASEYEALGQRCRLSASALDHPARLMRKRCIMYMKDPPGPDWDGVERLKAKTFEVVEDDEDILDERRSPAEGASESWATI
jgi:adenylate cyclase